jgi:hypothetical protein
LSTCKHNLIELIFIDSDSFWKQKVQILKYDLVWLNLEVMKNFNYEKSELNCKNSILHNFTMNDNIGRKKVDNTKKNWKKTKYISLDYDESSSYDENILSAINNKGQVKNSNYIVHIKYFKRLNI